MAQKSKVNAARTVHRSKPKLGQHFLRDLGSAQRCVEALGDIRNATVIEIGPGGGALTAMLAGRARRLIAIELDRMISAQLRMHYARRPNVEVIEADVLKVDLANLIARRPGPLLVTAVRPAGEEHERARVIGNLPYYITSDILLHLLEAHDWLETMVLMVQREVAERMAAKPGTRDYGLLSATVQLFTRAEQLFDLPPAAFAPPPKVHSSVVRLTVAPRAAELGVQAEEFLQFLRKAFAQKRKTLVNNLKAHYSNDELRDALKLQGIRADVRAEALSLEKMAELFKALAANSSK